MYRSSCTKVFREQVNNLRIEVRKQLKELQIKHLWHCFLPPFLLQICIQEERRENELHRNKEWIAKAHKIKLIEVRMCVYDYVGTYNSLAKKYIGKESKILKAVVRLRSFRLPNSFLRWTIPGTFQSNPVHSIHLINSGVRSRCDRLL